MGLEFNFEELEDALSRIDKKTSEKIIDKALDASAVPMLKKLDENVPFDSHELQDSLGEMRKEGNKINRKILLGSTSDKRDVVARAFYQEHGNSYMNGKKWMKKSYNKAKSESLDAMAKSLKNNLFK